jgi:hypothetical protein
VAAVIVGEGSMAVAGLGRKLGGPRSAQAVKKDNRRGISGPLLVREFDFAGVVQHSAFYSEFPARSQAM